MADQTDDTPEEDPGISLAPFVDDDDEPEAPAAAEDGEDGEDSAGEPDEEPAAGEPEGRRSRRERKAKADAVVAQRKAPQGKAARRTVTSRRVTPKGGSKAEPAAPDSKARDARKTEKVVSRTPPPSTKPAYGTLPSPWWVPALMFTLLILGALVIIGNYMVGDSASNTYLVIGLGLILGGIITATQYH